MKTLTRSEWLIGAGVVFTALPACSSGGASVAPTSGVSATFPPGKPFGPSVATTTTNGTHLAFVVDGQTLLDTDTENLTLSVNGGPAQPLTPAIRIPGATLTPDGQFWTANGASGWAQYNPDGTVLSYSLDDGRTVTSVRADGTRVAALQFRGTYLDAAARASYRGAQDVLLDGVLVSVGISAAAYFAAIAAFEATPAGWVALAAAVAAYAWEVSLALRGHH